MSCDCICDRNGQGSDMYKNKNKNVEPLRKKK